MITYFPQVYPDELLSSWLARFRVQSGYLRSCHAHSVLFRNIVTWPSLHFCNLYTDEAFAVISKMMDIPTILHRHTMYPCYYRFVFSKQKWELFRAMKNNVFHYVRINESQKNLAYCPVCAQEDREKYGEAYWHRAHQIDGMEICPYHGCYLKWVEVRKQLHSDFGIPTAEEVIGPVTQEAICQCTSAVMLRLAQYLVDVMMLPLSFENPVRICSYFKSVIAQTENEIYDVERVEKLSVWKDFNRYYSALPYNPLSRFEDFCKVLNGHQTSFFPVCMVGMFLEIPACDLANPPSFELERVTKRILTLRQCGFSVAQIANWFQIPHCSVMEVLWNAKQNPCALIMHPKMQEVESPDRAATNFRQIDEMLLPRVQNAIYQLMGNERVCPDTVSRRKVAQRVRVLPTFLQKLPLCSAEICKHYYSLSEYKAMKIVWAARLLEKHNMPIEWHTLYLLTNIQRRTFADCLEYLPKYADEELYRKLLAVQKTAE